jgi:hypothetical protein
MQFYTDIVKKSWQITWRHKTLWIFGVFAALWGAKGIEAEINSARRLASDSSPLNPSFWSAAQWESTIEQLTSLGSVTVSSILVGLLLLIVGTMVVLSHIGIIDAFNQFAEKDAPSEQYALHHAFAAGKKHFWVVLSLHLIGKGLSYLLLGLIFMPLFFNGDLSASRVWWVLVGLLLYIPVSIVISIVTRHALNHAVLQHETVLASLRDGWNMFRQNIGVALELAVVMLCVFLCLSVLIVPVLAAVLTLPSLVVLMAGAPDLYGLPWTYLHDRFYIVAFLSLIIVVRILFSIWHIGSWTMLYKKLSSGKQKSKTHRWLNSHK